MPPSNADAERINVFRVDERYLFSHYFGRTDIFGELQTYYNDEEYRFEIPADEFDVVRERLTEEYFDLVVVDELEPFGVVKERYTKHADILRNSVAHWERRGHLFFIMKDELAVEAALEQGAERVAETDFVMGL